MLILLVCSGNTCRSPLAEAILANMLAADLHRSHHRVASAGTGAEAGAPASEGSRRMAAERQITLANHFARQLTREMIAEADLILTMTPSHLAIVKALGGAGKSATLVEFAGGEPEGSIPDPFGSGVAAYQEMAAALDAKLRSVVTRLPRATPP